MDANVKMCVYVCPTGYYIQNLTNNWKCVSSCASLFIDYVGKKCVSTCPDGTYAHSTQECLIECPDTFFADPVNHKCAGDCDDAAGYFADPTTKTCVQVCPHGYFGDSSSGSKICELQCQDATEYGDPLQNLCVDKALCSSPYSYGDDFSR